MKVTIVTVCRNSAATLPDTLRSVAEQSYPDIEHVIVDGASRDATSEVVKQHGTHVAQFVSEPDHGIYDAMNKGLGLASGDVIGFLNADDRYADDHVIARVVTAMKRDSLDAVFGDVAFFRPGDPGRVVRRYRSDRFHPRRLAWGWMPAHPALFVRRDVFRQAGAFRTDYRIAGDFEFIARAFKDETLRYRHISDVLVMMRTGGVSNAGWRNTLLLNREVLRACRENGISTNLLKILSKYPAKLLEFRWP